MHKTYLDSEFCYVNQMFLMHTVLFYIKVTFCCDLHNLFVLTA